MAALKISLFGGFEALNASGEPLVLAGRKMQALLALLAMMPGVPQPREKLTALLWGDRAEEQARGSLRQALAELRRALDGVEPMPLVTDRDSVFLDARAVEVDVTAFENAIAESGPDALARAAALYGGDLLDGFTAAEPEFEEWLRDERVRLGGLAGDAFSRLLNHQTSVGDTEAAIATARRLLALDPLREPVHRTLMRLYAEKGDRIMAVRQYQACRDVLKDELGLEPEAETERLAAKIRSGAVAAGEADEPATADEPSAAKPLPLPDKPSIAVLPFQNLSGDPEQEYFSDGITEDIITELSRFGSLFVIARNSSFTFKGEMIDVSDVGRKLGVQYVVEGSVRKAGNRVRVTAQLVEAATGKHVWAERYDRDLEDIFAVQDEVVREIVAAVPGQIDAAALQRIQRRPIENLTAYDLVLRGEQLRYQNWSSREADALFEKAVEIDPQCARAYSQLAHGHGYSIFSHFAPADEARRLTRSFAERAVQFDPNDPAIQATIAEAYLMVGDLESARRCIEKAIKLNSNDYVVMLYAGTVLAYTGDIDGGLRWTEKVFRHDPFSIANTSQREGLLEIYYMALRYDDAIDSVTEWRDPPTHVRAEIAATYAQLGRMDEAQAMRRQYESDLPEGYDFNDYLTAQLSMCARQQDRDNWLEGFRKAGFDV
jgi:TolB-like protein